MNNFQQQFIDCAIASKVLSFDEFILKSGRISPYFFNAGKFYQGSALSIVGQCYAQAIVHAQLEYDVLFGPAYKGIPLVSAIAIALHQMGIDKPYAFNRKEAKGHGEGGDIVGAPIEGKRLLIVDDVITAGSAINDVMKLLDKESATAVAVVVGLDRQERVDNGLSAIQNVEHQHDIQATSIINLTNLIQYLQQSGDAILPAIESYLKQYGI